MRNGVYDIKWLLNQKNLSNDDFILFWGSKEKYKDVLLLCLEKIGSNIKKVDEWK